MIIFNCKTTYCFILLSFHRVYSKNNTPIQTENRLEDRCTKQFQSDDHYFGSMKETSHKGNSYASVPSNLHISNDIDASSLSSCSTEKGANFMLNGCSLNTLLSKSYNVSNSFLLLFIEMYYYS